MVLACALSTIQKQTILRIPKFVDFREMTLVYSMLWLRKPSLIWCAMPKFEGFVVARD